MPRLVLLLLLQLLLVVVVERLLLSLVRALLCVWGTRRPKCALSQKYKSLVEQM